MKSRLEKVIYMCLGALIALIGYMFGVTSNVSVTADSKPMSRSEFENLLDKRLSEEGLLEEGWKLGPLNGGVQTQPQTKSSVIDEIVVRKLRVVDAQGKTVAVLGKQAFPLGEMGILEVYDTEGNTVLSLAQDSNGGRIAVTGKDRGLVGLRVDDAGGRVSVFGKSGSVADLHIDGGTGGAVSVWGEGGKGAVGLRINDAGGLVSVLGKDNENKAGLSIEKTGGTVVVSGKDNKGAILAVTDTGGQVKIFGEGGKGTAALSISDTGGVLSVLGKDMKGAAVLATDETGGFLTVGGKDGGSIIR
ncbi:MAG: hypothetical protein OXD54_13505 [Candidatus Poribacteria bacterium]|nr:hypothetical protein [Candidatus Poribacteria bacterium]